MHSMEVSLRSSISPWRPQQPLHLAVRRWSVVIVIDDDDTQRRWRPQDGDVLRVWPHMAQ